MVFLFLWINGFGRGFDGRNLPTPESLGRPHPIVKWPFGHIFREGDFLHQKEGGPLL